MCACPAQLAVQLLELRTLHDYQLACMGDMPDMADSHRTIAEAAAQAHALLEQAFDRVLELEGWDKASLEMPDGLRKKRDALL
jgi:3-deoxy-D-manno-octulosonate 8-phosphate phosphatase KdsC-like HAD superfamily phosphatase